MGPRWYEYDDPVYGPVDLRRLALVAAVSLLLVWAPKLFAAPDDDAAAALALARARTSRPEPAGLAWKASYPWVAGRLRAGEKVILVVGGRTPRPAEVPAGWVMFRCDDAPLSAGVWECWCDAAGCWARRRDVNSRPG